MWGEGQGGPRGPWLPLFDTLYIKYHEFFHFTPRMRLCNHESLMNQIYFAVCGEKQTLTRRIRVQKKNCFLCALETTPDWSQLCMRHMYAYHVTITKLVSPLHGWFLCLCTCNIHHNVQATVHFLVPFTDALHFFFPHSQEQRASFHKTQSAKHYEHFYAELSCLVIMQYKQQFCFMELHDLTQVVFPTVC